MDDDNSPARRLALVQGGTVEPTSRAAAAKERARPLAEVPGERYEMRDPVAEVTYRANTFADIAGKADALRSNRFVAVDWQGNRTTLQKIEGEWQRGPKRPAPPERVFDDLTSRERVESPPGVVRVPDALPRSKAGQMPGERGIDIRADRAADRAAMVSRIEAALNERYVISRAPVTAGDVPIGRTEYRFRGDTSRVAFTESTFRLATDNNNPSVARSMVDVAEARNWRALRVSGNEDFKRMVWLEASVRGVKTIGYEPVAGDMEVLRQAREARQLNRIEAVSERAGVMSEAVSSKQSARGSGGRKAVLAALDAVLVSKGVPEKKRQAVMAAAAENLAQRLAAGQTHKVKVYDKSAPSQRPVVRPTPELQRTREQVTPTR